MIHVLSYSARKLLPVFVGFLATDGAKGAVAAFTVPDSYFTTRGFNEAHGNGMIGWTFQVDDAITVTQIGWYDQGQDGLSRSYQVGLWQSAGGINFTSGMPSLVGSTTTGLVIPGGTSATLNGLFRVVDLESPLILQPGIYQIGGLDTATTTDPIRYFHWSEFFLDPPSEITLRNFFYAASTSATPGFHSVPTSQFHLEHGIEAGPMLFVVPEPSGVHMAGLGGMILCARRRRCLGGVCRIG